MKSIKQSKNWHLCMKEGVFSAVTAGFTQDYFTPFILLLNATVSQIGFLNAFPNLFAAIVQVKNADFADFLGSRKKTVLLAVGAQAFLLLFVSALIFLNFINVWFFIGLAIIFVAAGAVISGSYSSMLVDFLQKERQGEYLGRRNKIVGFVMILGSLAAGTFLYYFKIFNVFYVFGYLFLGAFLFRITSFYFFSKIEEKPLMINEDDRFTLLQFFRRLPASNFARFVIFSACMQFAANIASPFFALMMLGNLGFNYLTYTLVTAASTATVYFMMQRWGHHADIVGNIHVLKFVAPFIGVVPLLWVLDQHPVYLIFAQIFSGFVWSGFTLCTANFVYDAVTEQKRTRCISYFNFCNGIAVCLGALTGGIILKHLPSVFGYQFLTLCIISGVLRLLVGLIFPLFLKEVRTVKTVRSRELFLSVVGIKSISPN